MKKFLFSYLKKSKPYILSTEGPFLNTEPMLFDGFPIQLWHFSSNY